MKTTKKTTLYAYIQIRYVTYICHWCKEGIGYATDGLPPTEKCHKCLKPLKFKIVCLTK